MTSQNEYHVAIFQAMLSGLSSEWFHELNDLTQCSIERIVRPFVRWMNNVDKNRDSNNRYGCLIDYNIYRKNEIKLKTSTVHRLRRIITNGLFSPKLNSEELNYLENLLKVSRVPPDEEAQGHSLTQWFAQFDIRKSLGEDKFLMLESPRQLLASFRVTIAVTLSFLIEVRRLWKERPSPEAEPQLSNQHWYQEWNLSVLRLKGSFISDTAPIRDILTNFLIADFIMPEREDYFLNAISCKQIDSIPSHFNGKRVWRVPKCFTPEYEKFYTEIEEVLAGWLIASLTIQPSDVGKLKSSNFAFEYALSGRLQFMQIKYYKGRADSVKESEIVPGSDTLAQALHAYIKNLPGDDSKLFRQEFNKSLQFPDLKSTYNSRVGLLFRTWNIPEVNDQLHKELIKAKTTPIFLDAMLAIKNNENIDTNRKVVANSKNPKFIFLFRLLHVKTTAVHAQSDKYRESDLVNYNSHSSVTEKQAYLTDQNAEWVNQCGRITRLVLHDLQNVVYRPSIERIKRNTSELLSRTKLTPNIGLTEKDIKEINRLPGTFEDIQNPHQIIVVDSVETAIYFIHYINQAETMFETLNRVRPDFVERTLIIEIEWMTQMLSRMKSAMPAQAQYLVFQKHLAPVFDYLLETNE